MGAAHMFSFVLGLSSNSLVRSVLFLFGLPGSWQSSSTGVFTLDNPSQETQSGFFGNDGSLYDSCFDLLDCASSTEDWSLGSREPACSLWQVRRDGRDGL